MNFSYHDHSLNRMASFTWNDWLDHTAGAAVRVAGDYFDIPNSKSQAVSRQVVLGLMSALAGLKGHRFDSGAACRAFFVGEVQLVLGEHVKKQYSQYHPHFVSQDDWGDFLARIGSEFVALVDAKMKTK